MKPEPWWSNVNEFVNWLQLFKSQNLAKSTLIEQDDKFSSGNEAFKIKM